MEPCTHTSQRRKNAHLTSRHLEGGGAQPGLGPGPCPPQQKIVVLGAPLGSEGIVQHGKSRKRNSQDELLRRLPSLSNLQAAWLLLLLLFCASPGPTTFCMLPPPAACAGLTTLLSQAPDLAPARARAAPSPLRLLRIGLVGPTACLPSCRAVAEGLAGGGDAAPAPLAAAQQAVDATIVSPVTRAGPNIPRACTCPSLPLGGRWRRGRRPIPRKPPWFAGHPASAAPAAMQPAAQSAWVARWSGLLTVAAQSAFAASLLELPLARECHIGRETPELQEVLADGRWQLAVHASRLGPR